MLDVSEYFRQLDSQYVVGENEKIVVGYPKEEFIHHYIIQHDNDFYEPLSARVDIKTYSTKLSELSTTFILFLNDDVTGLICSYFYDVDSQKGFITLVHTKKEYRGRHLSVKLLEAVKNYARGHGFKSISLFVSRQQTSAYNLYLHHDFEVLSEGPNGRCHMQCIL